MFIELTPTNTEQHALKAVTPTNTKQHTSKALIAISQIVAIWEDTDGQVRIITTENVHSFSVAESYDAIKFLLKMHQRTMNDTPTDN